MRKSLLASLFLLIVLAGSFGIAQAAPFAVKPGHPRMFITPESIPELRNRAATASNDTYAYLKNWADQNWNNSVQRTVMFGYDCEYDSGILRYALIYALGEVTGFDYSQHSVNDYGDKAVETLFDYISTPSLRQYYYYRDMAVAYDWVNDRMNASQKSQVVNFLVSIGGSTPSLETSPREYRGVRTPRSFYAGLAFYGDGINDAQAQKYVDLIPQYLDSMKALSHTSGEDGGGTMGLCYTVSSVVCRSTERDFYALITSTNLTIDDTFTKYGEKKMLPDWLLYGIQPGPRSVAYYSSNDVATVTKWEDCGSHVWNIRKTSNILMQSLRAIADVAKREGDEAKAEWTTWLINTRLQASRQDSTFDIIFNDRTTPATPPDVLNVPTSKAFGWNEAQDKIDSYLGNPKAGLGNVYMKSSWDPGANTTQASFKAYPYFYFGHVHYDSLAFSIFKGEPLALPNTGSYFYWYEGRPPDSNSSNVAYNSTISGFPHHYFYYERTQSANSLLIMDPNETIKVTDPFFSGGFKDGGQRDTGDVDVAFTSVIEGSFRDWGGLTRYEDGSGYTYSSADATKGYNSIVDGITYLTPDASPKVSLVQRDFVYLKSTGGNSDYFVVFDRINSTNSTFRKVFLLHTPGEPILNGAQTQIYGGSQGGLYQSDNTDAFTITQTKAKLFMKTLLPGATKVYKFGGTGISTTTQFIDNVTGINFKGPKIDIPVASTAEFPDKPIVTINDKEAFMCDGKNSTHLTGCIRGYRYYKYNSLLSHNSGSTVKENYAWMYREAGTGNWISHPFNYGVPNGTNDIIKDCDEYGRWGLRIETASNEYYSNFLHVLHPTVDMGEAAMADTSLIDSGTGNMKGALIKDPLNLWIVMFPKEASDISHVSYAADYLPSQTGRHLILGLVPNAQYNISKNGATIATKTASNQGVISFDSPGGSTFELTATGYTPPLCIHKSDNNPCDGCVDATELTTFIDRWKMNNQDVTLKEIIEAIGLWKKGC